MNSGDKNPELESAALEELVARLKAAGHENAIKKLVLGSFLKETKQNVGDAEKRVLETIEWRNANNIDNILQDNFDDIWQPFSYEWAGYAKDGRPVLTVNTKLDKAPESDKEVKAIIQQGIENKERNTRFVYYLLEIILSKIEESNADSIVVIQDMNKLQPAKFTTHMPTVVPLGLDLANTCLTYYPRIVSQIFVINGSKKVARLALGILRRSLKHILKNNKNPYPTFERIKDKSSEKKSKKAFKKHVQILGKKKEKWAPILQNYIDGDQLTERYGGTKA